MNLKSSPRKKNEFNFARDLSLSGEPTFFRDRESGFFRDPGNYCDRHGSCNSSERIMDRNSFAGSSTARGGMSSQSASAFLPEKSRRLFERWDSHQDNVIPQRKYTILPQIGNPRFISIQDSRHQFVNQLDYSRDNFEKDADFFADYNKSWNHEEVISVRGVPLPPLTSAPAQHKLNFMHQAEEDISEETSRCFTNSMTLSDNLATSTLGDFTDDSLTITSANGEYLESKSEENITCAKNKEHNGSGVQKSDDGSSYDSERGDVVNEIKAKKNESDDKRMDKEQKQSEIDTDKIKHPEKKDSDRYGSRTEEGQVKPVKCKEMLAQTNLVDKSNKDKTGYTKKAANTTSQKTTTVKVFKNLRKFVR